MVKKLSYVGNIQCRKKTSDIMSIQQILMV